MTLIFTLAICYAIPSAINSYCFLFQRTARKIRQYAVGTTGVGLENRLLPDWYHILIIFSYVRYIPLIWLLFEDWRLAIGLYLGFGIIKVYWPVNDYGNTQKIKRYFIKKMRNGTFDKNDEEFYTWVTAAEIEIKKPEPELPPDARVRKQVINYIKWSFYLLFFWLAYEFGGYFYALMVK